MDKSTFDFVPEIREFNSVQDLIKEIRIIEEREPLPTDKFSKVPDNCFEQVRIDKENFILLPTKRDYLRLYRGENEIHTTSKPTIFRTELSVEEFLIEKMKFFEFEQILKQHPVVNEGFIKEKILVDAEGLAQHYGLKTEILDLTSDLNIAIFFATCFFDKEQNTYFPYSGTEQKKGVIFICYTPIVGIKNNSFSRWGSLLNPIGLQPFKRPGKQKGFSIKLTKEQDFNKITGIFRYTFLYDRHISDFYYKMFNSGKDLWVNDPLVGIVEDINRKNIFSFNSFYRAFKTMNLRNNYLKILKNKLEGKGFIFSCNDYFYFNKKEMADLRKKWQLTDKYLFYSNIVKRKTFSKKNGWDEYCNIEIIEEMDLLRMLQRDDTIN